MIAGAVPMRAGHAAIGVPDHVPAATLLFPYFEVDLGFQHLTLLAVEAATDQAVLVKVTLWSDLGVPYFAFDLYLTGYDIQTINLRDVFEGELPRTIDDDSDTADRTPQGPLSEDVSFPDCGDPGLAPQLTAEQIAFINAAATGQDADPDPNATACYGADHGDGIKRGYVTMDVVTRCTASDLLPTHPDYFTGDNRIVSDDNLIVGDWMHIDPANNLAYGERAVHLEASASDPGTTTPDEPTFYGALVGWQASDHREPLPTRWQTPYLGPPTPLFARSQLLVWRDPKEVRAPRSCDSPTPMLPLDEVAVFDLAEDALDITQTSQIPYVAQRVLIGPGTLPVPWRMGFMHLSFGHDPPGPALPEGVAGFSQSVVVAVGHNSLCGSGGRFESGFFATAIDTGLAPLGSRLGAPEPGGDP